MAYALVVSQTVRVAAAARGTRRAVSARRPATVTVRASYRSDDVAVSVRATRAVGGLASVAAVAAAPAAPAQAAAAELAQVRRFPRLKPRSRRASPRRGSLIRCVSLHRRDRVSPVTLRSPLVSLATSRHALSQVATSSPLESARLFVAIATVALILFQGPKGDGVVNSLNENRVFGSAGEAKSAVDYVTAGLIGGFIVLSAILATQQ